MAEYIERDDLIGVLNGVALELLKDGSIQCSLAAGTVVDIKDNVVAKLPTADVVPVVRCKDCKHYKNEWCEILKAESPVPDGFCCYGERRCE